MTTQRVVKKNLAGQEDITYGEGSVTQSRNGGNFTINQVRNIQPVNSIAERDALDVLKFPKCRLYPGDGTPTIDYQYISGVWTRIDQDTIIPTATVLTMIALTGLVAGNRVKTDENTTGNGGGGEYLVIATGTTAGVDLPNAKNIIAGVADATISFVLVDDPLPAVSQWGSFGGATDETAIWQAIIDEGIRHILVPYNAAGYTINTLTNSSNTTFVFQGDSPMNGTQTLSSLGLVTDSGYIGGAAMADDLRDGKIEIVSGTIRQEQPQSVAGITRSGTSGIINQVAHGYSVGDYVVVDGANETGYNGTAQVAQVDNVDTYRVLVDSGLTTPATGTITAFKAGKWEWIKDSTHEPLGVKDTEDVLSDGSGYGLLVKFSKTYSKVLTMVVGPDETISGASGMVIGSSVSTSAIAFRASLNKTVAGRVLYDGANWAVSMGTDQGTIYTTNAPNPFPDISYSGGNLTLNHSFCLGSDINLTPNSAGGTATPFIPVLKSNTDDGAVINFLHVNAGALALYTGAASTQLSFQFTKNSNRLIKFDGSDRSSETKMYFGNIWFFGIMQV